MPGNEDEKFKNTSSRTGAVKLGNLKRPVLLETEDENAIEHELEGREPKGEHKDSDSAQSVQPERRPVVEIGPPRSANAALSKGAMKDALRDWKVERSPSGYRASRTFTRDRLTDQGSRVTAKRGSTKEVEGMFALAEAKGWDHMAFDGNDTFKERVMRTALEKGYEVKANSKYDQKLFDKVRQKFEADHANGIKGNSDGVEQPKVSQQNDPTNGALRQTPSTGNSKENANPALPALKNVTGTGAKDTLRASQMNEKFDQQVALTDSKQISDKLERTNSVNSLR
jgi:hypothetical protein